MQSSEKIDKLIDDVSTIKTDVAVIRVGLDNHLMHHTELKTEMQWRMGLAVGLITFFITTGINIIFRFW